MNPNVKFKIAHTGKNLIYIDSCSCSSDMEETQKESK